MGVKIILTDHFRRRYRERVGYLSEQTLKEKLRAQVSGFDGSIVEVKFKFGEFFVYAARSLRKPDIWTAVTISRPRKKKAGGSGGRGSDNEEYGRVYSLSDPTGNQLDYLYSLMAQLGHDEQDLGIESGQLSRQKVSELIGQLKEELEG